MNILDRIELAVINLKLGLIESELDYTLTELKQMNKKKHNENKNLERLLRSISKLEKRR